ncbi:MAG: hypothetical protein JW760_14460 [Spirochaetales bacterium]|nr:hypothetical protein [Spirochaetales bacterium]
MDFFEKMQEGLSDGLAASKDLLKKAGGKAKDLGEIGILKYEIAQLENMSEKLASRLGVTAYQLLREKNLEVLTAETPELKPVIDEIDETQRKLEKKRMNLEMMQRK